MEHMELKLLQNGSLVRNLKILLLMNQPYLSDCYHHPQAILQCDILKEREKEENTVLRLMRDQGYINHSEHAQYRAMTLESINEDPTRGLAPYFTEYVRRLLEKEDEALDINIYRDGLKIYTTLDSRLQSIAEKVILEAIHKSQEKLNNRIINNQEEFELLGHLTIFDEDSVKMMMRGEAQLFKDLRSKLLVQTAFVAINPKTGGIIAMIGGRPDYHDQYNRAVQARRQPGSVF